MNKLLSALVISLGLTAGAQAGELLEQGTQVRDLHKQNFIGQRAYHKAPVAKADADDKWQGATLVTDKVSEDKGHDKHQQLRLHFIGKRPYTAAE